MNRLIKIVSLAANWIYWRTLVKIPVFRPANIRIEGKLRLCPYSRISLDKQSSLVVKGNLLMKNSKLYLNGSEMNLKGDIFIYDSRLVLSDSRWDTGHRLYIKEFLIKMNSSSLIAEDHLLFWKEVNYNAWLLTANAHIRIGKNVRIESKTSCENSTLTIGSNVFLNYGTELRCHKEVNIGNDVLISYECMIFDTNTHSLDAESRKREIRNGFPNNTKQSANEQPEMKAVHIGNNAWIGMRAAILKGSSIGNNAIVGTQCVVAGNVPDDHIAVGNPFILKSPKNQK